MISPFFIIEKKLDVQCCNMGLLRTRVEATLEMIHNWESRVIYHRETLRKKAL